MLRPCARSAHIWKDQKTMTKAHEETSDKEKILSHIRVNIALKVMRKAHVEKSAADKQKLNFQKVHDGEKSVAIAKLPYSEMSIFKINKVDDILKETKSKLNHKKNSGYKRESKSYGKPKRICQELVDEIKKEMEPPKKNKRKKNTINTLSISAAFSVSTVNQLDENMDDNLPEPVDNSHRNVVLLRPLSANNAITSINNRLINNRPHSAEDNVTTVLDSNEKSEPKPRFHLTRTNTKVTFAGDPEDDFKFPNEDELTNMIDKLVVRHPFELQKGMSSSSLNLRGSILMV